MKLLVGVGAAVGGPVIVPLALVLILAGIITPAGPGDQINLPGVSLNSVTGYDYLDNGPGGLLSIHTVSGDIQLKFSGHFNTQGFTPIFHGLLKISWHKLAI